MAAWHAASTSPALGRASRLRLSRPRKRTDGEVQRIRSTGFLRMTLDLKRCTLIGEYFAAYSAASGSTGLPALRDSFTLDLSKHRIS